MVFLTVIAVVNIILGASFLVLYTRKNKECIKLKKELKTIHTQINKGSLKEWVTETENKAWRNL